MALVSTLLIGGAVWAWGLAHGGNRAARGMGGWLVWTLLFAFVAALVAAWARRNARPPTSRGAGIARALRDTVLIALAAALALGVGIPLTGAGDLGIDEDALVVLFAVALIVPGLGLVALAPWIRPRTVIPLGGGPRVVSAGAVVRALAPMLLPALVLFTLLRLPVAPEWQGRITGRGLAGIAFLQLETLAWPAAIMVAWAIDVVDGSRSRRWHRTLAALAAAALIACAIVPPRIDAASTYALGPALTEGALEPSLGPLLRATALMLLGCAELSSQWLLKVRRWGVAPGRGALIALFVVPVPMLALGVMIGPQAVPLAAVLGCGVAWATARPMGRPAAPADASAVDVPGDRGVRTTA